MQLVASLAFVVWMYGAMAVIGLSFVPFVLLKPELVHTGARLWARATMAGARWLVGIRWQVEGLEHLPSHPVLIASKHSSMLDTIVPFLVLERPSFVLKKELLDLPVFGFFARKIGIAIDRDGQMAALKQMVAEAREVMAMGRSLVIYPEGTRQPVGAAPDYKPGVAAIYGLIGTDCAPLAHNGGLLWPSHGLLRRPGVVTFRFLPLIPAGQKRQAFMEQLQTAIESQTNAMVAAPPALNQNRQG
jgi:1-acyl-sn-glycerol-3-phosphate acyltransferase